MNTNDILNISILQSDLTWENPSKNRENFEQKINQISTPVDLIVLPEMFTTGFTMNAEKFAEKMDGKTIKWMQKIANKKNSAITGSVIISESNSFFNRLLFVYPSGKIKIYDKRHTFTLAGEDKIYSSGNCKLIIDYKGWKICPLICYDLRFPVWARNTENYDILLYVASWPKLRVNAWDTLLKARAIENMSYVIGVNRVGKDANNYEYSGNSIVLDSLGNNLSSPSETINLNNGNELIVSKTLSKNYLMASKNKFRFLEDKDKFIIK
ncbi:amidohydrolase [Tenacibaculum sp.]|nr:amidohydrolase [Tenacibaculum sp.]